MPSVNCMFLEKQLDVITVVMICFRDLFYIPIAVVWGQGGGEGERMGLGREEEGGYNWATK